MWIEVQEPSSVASRRRLVPGRGSGPETLECNNKSARWGRGERSTVSVRKTLQHSGSPCVKELVCELFQWPLLVCRQAEQESFVLVAGDGRRPVSLKRSMESAMWSSMHRVSIKRERPSQYRPKRLKGSSSADEIPVSLLGKNPRRPIAAI